MTERFEKLVIGIARIHKSIQKIKKSRMRSIGLKGTHVMCLYYLNKNRQGLTASDLCGLCREDKAGISRILSDLERGGFICYDIPAGEKKYRTKAGLTATGKSYARKVSALIRHAVRAGGRGLTNEEREIFYRVLFQIADNLEALCAELSVGQEKKKFAERNPL